ncbi:MAG: ribonuclease R [Clostridiales bacterium]|nr:ribonuclease R [Clostridiales bacterium]
MNKNNDRANKIIEFMKTSHYTPLTRDELAIVLEVPKEDKEQFAQVLETLLRDNKVRLTKKKRFIANRDVVTYIGKIEGSKRGFSFFIEQNRQIDDIFIPFENLKGAIHQDQVEIKLVKRAEPGRKSVGLVTRIIKRSRNTITGIVEKDKHFFFVRPLDKKTNIIDIARLPRNVRVGDVVEAKITDTKKNGKFLVGEIVNVIGNSSNTSSYIKAIIKDNEYTQIFSDNVIKEANRVSELKITTFDHEKRKDLRKVVTITVDGEDAKDLDDAITISKKDDGQYLLGVHIADVSHYVKEGSSLDLEALQRGTSVYLVDSVIPMLPKQLSNNICSLNPKVDRLAFSVMMSVDKSGNVTDFDIVESIINVNERMTYKNVQLFIDGNQEIVEKYKHISKEMKLMNELCDILTNKRKLRGSIDFNFKESKVLVDNKQEPIAITSYDRLQSNKIIEEFMILCNETVAQHFDLMQMPFMYRIHEKPDATKIENLLSLAKGLGIAIKHRKTIHPQILRELVDSVKGTKVEHLINTVTLRSMKKAQYSPYNEGHFGLASTYYCHFTSPIRRYPDLLIHRLMKDYIHGKDISKVYEKTMSQLQEIAKTCSETERKAELAERNVIDLYKTIYMKRHIGDTFMGVVSGVTQYGLYVELENTVEGFVSIEQLQGYYKFDKESYKLYKERSNFFYTLGDQVQVKVVAVNVPLREIDMTMIKKI